MKKKHTKKASLLIGLLSLYSLSACVHTRQTLGNEGNDNFQQHNSHSATYKVNDDKVTLISIKPSRDSSGYSDPERADADNSKATNSCTWKKKTLIGLAVFSAVGLASLPVGVGLGCALGLSFCPFGGTSLLPTIVSSNNPNNMFVLPEDPFNAINKGDRRKGRMYNLEKVSTLKPSFDQFEPTEAASTENKSTEDIFFQGMTIYQLHGQILKKDFDPRTLEKWWKDGLNPNMEDSHNERTLFMVVMDHYKNIKKNNTKAVEIINKFLQTGKINFSKKDSYEYTVWDYVKNNNFLKGLLQEYKQKK